MSNNTKKKSSNKSGASAKKTGTAFKNGTPTKKKLTVAQRRELERQQKITQLLIIVGSLVVAFIIVTVFLIMMDNNSGKTTSDYINIGGSSTSSTLAAGVYPASTEYTIAPDGEQLKAPSAGEEVAVFETSMGTIKIRLFPEYVPTAVENFKTLIEQGCYNGITFHRVIDNFMIQGGIRADGGGCAFDGYDSFQDEFGRNLYNIRGALSMANTGVDNTNSSQFFIVQAKTPLYGNLIDSETFKAKGGSSWAADAYEKYGGTPYLDGQFKSITGNGHTVFGQVYEGMDVVDKIAAIERDGNDKPLKDITINRAYLETVK